MAKVIQALVQDHRKVEKLFSQFEQKGDPDVALQICQELKVHTTLEEELVYPILERQVDKDMAKEANQEHAEADKLITQIEKSTGDPAKLAELMTELQGAIQHHVEEEETEVFPEMEQEAGDRLEAITAKFMDRKQRLSAAGTGTSKKPGNANRRSGTRDDLMDLTKDELYQRAQDADIPGRSEMNKEQLAEALSKVG